MSGNIFDEPALQSQLNPNVSVAQPHNTNIWEIWIHNKLIAMNWEPAGPYPWKFQQINKMISTVEELTSAFAYISDENLGQNFEFIFCRKGMTPEQMDPIDGYGHWLDYSSVYAQTLAPSLTIWKTWCVSLMESNFRFQHVYGLKITKFSGNTQKIFCWVAPYVNPGFPATQFTQG